MLAFATSTPTAKQVRARISGGVLPSIAAGDHHMSSLETFIYDKRQVESTSTNPVQKCLGILAVLKI